MTTILVAAVYSDELFAALKDQFPDHRLVRLPHGGEVPTDASDASILLWCSDTNESLLRTLQMASDLKWIHSCTAGLDQLWDPQLAHSGIVVTRSAATSHIPVAEWAMACVLTLAKQLPKLATMQKQHAWSAPDPIELYGSTIGIVGSGAIGREVARRARGFGMNVLGLRRVPGELPEFDGVLGRSDLKELLSTSDFVVLCCPLNRGTRSMIGWSELLVMKPSAYLVNVARGELVVEDALVRALERDVIAGAALDVFAYEPLPPDHPLWSLPNVIITPHAAWRSPEVRVRGITEFADNLRRYLSGEPLANVVDTHEFD